MKLWGNKPKPEPPVDVPEIATLALDTALSLLPRHRPPRVLDLGPASGPNVSFFSQFGCQLEIIDLFAALSDHRARGTAVPLGGSRIGAAVSELLERSEAGHQSGGDRIVDESASVPRGYDLILAWDLLDYLEEREITELFRVLRPQRQVGTRMLALVSYRGPIPSRPRRFRVLDRTHLVIDDSAPSDRPSPVHKEPRLLKLMPGFVVESCYLMRHGIQEYLFVERDG